MAELTSSDQPPTQTGFGPMLNRVISADPLAVRQVLVDLADRLRPAVEPEALAQLELALAEILNNIVEHAYEEDDPGVIHLSVVSSERGLSCAVADDGALLPSDCLAPRAHPGAGVRGAKVMNLPEGGFGWVLIQGLCQDLCYYRENGRNFLAFALPAKIAALEPPEETAVKQVRQPMRR